jgi:hypothetical protein
MLLLDSLGPAMVGDMSAAKDIIGFHNNYIAPFKGIAVTPILVDHQARQQAGEGYQSKGAFGSAYKEHLSRSLIQIERGDQDADDGKLNVRMRHKKTNFGPMVDPFDVALTFGIDKIAASVRELLPSEKAQENTLNKKERILAALEGEPLFPEEVVEATGLNPGTVKNSITQLKKAGKIAITGQMNGRAEQVQLAASSSRPLKDRADDAANPKTVARLFANPPEWLRTGMKLYRENPDRHFRAMCTSVAAEVLGDGNRRPEIEDEVRKALEQPPLEQA